jgi:aromatic-L-amino-acid decarboxylase
MHGIDQTTESMVRSVLAYAENRLRLDPVPLDQATLSATQLADRLSTVIGPEGRGVDEVLGVYASVIAPSIISADSPRFLGFIPAAPTKASLLFDMLVSCASIQGISWLEASGAIAAENTVLRLIADEAGLPASAGGCFVSAARQGTSRRSRWRAKPRRSASVRRLGAGVCGLPWDPRPIRRSSTR